MDSLGSIQDKMSGVVAGFGLGGLGLGDSGGNETSRIICFHGKGGEKVCERFPVRDEVLCNGDGLCSVFLTGLDEDKAVEDVASQLGLRTFVTLEGDKVAKNITGALRKEDLSELAEGVGRSLSPQKADRLREINLGAIQPPSQCRINPLAPECEPYITSAEWHYLGPLKGWVQADSLEDSLDVTDEDLLQSSGRAEPPEGQTAQSNSNVLTTV
jgi:hypothetical protein